MYPSDFRDTSENVRITLLSALCSSRQAEITDALVDLLIALVHKINARAKRRVEKQLTAELKKVRGKEGINFKLAEAAVGKPDEVVRRALYPVVVGQPARQPAASPHHGGGSRAGRADPPGREHAPGPGLRQQPDPATARRTRPTRPDRPQGRTRSDPGRQTLGGRAAPTPG
jgi:hypothetical protein